jgi:ABC-type transport system involved in cytochrome c biogenesis permease subunit
VVLASAGIALLGVACVAGLAFLFEDRRLKAKRRAHRRLRLPSLEALDRVNATALATGFPLLTVGVLAGMMWVQAENGRPWTGTVHETWSVIAWAIYGALVVARFHAHQAARQAALSAVAGFVFLFVAVIGVGLFA